jgi:LmbE family N-acetylglucosaminyl deacetylase
MLGSLLVALTLSPSLPPAQPDAAHLARRIERLAGGGRVLYVAAHPDDENTRLIAWLVHVKKMDVAYLSITRGDGGQNLIGAEQGPALGALRTQELLAARRLDGARQFFTRARDFGFSKSPEEALRIWGRQRILEDVVWVYRTFRPDVVVTRFSPEPSETHGHHTASAQLAVEAFTAAADPQFAPEQVARAGTWQPRRIVWNAGFFFSKPPEDLSAFLQEQVNPYDPLLGLSMGELAGDSRSMHKSQGFGAGRNVAPAAEYFLHLAGQRAQASLLDGVPTALPEGTAMIALRKARIALRPEAPHEAIPALLEALEALGADPARAGLREDVQEAIGACAGLHLDALAAQAAVAPGATLPITLGAVLRLPAKLSLESVSLGSQVVAGPGALQPGKPWETKEALRELPPPLSSDPAWLLKPPEEGYYPVEALEDRVRPEPAPPLLARFALKAGGQSFVLQRPVVYRWVDPVQGQRTRALEFAPPVAVDAAAPLLLFPGPEPRPLRVFVRAAAGAAQGRLIVEPPAGFSVEPAERPFSLSQAGAEVELSFEVRPGPEARRGELHLVAEVGGARWDRGVRRIEYAHVPPQAWHPISTVHLSRFDLRRGPSRIGYVAGAGDEVAQVLAQVGYQVTPLDEAALRDSDLSHFDAIVLGVRSFNVHPWLWALQPRLDAYVERGGVVLVQYVTRNFVSKLPGPLGPWPFEVSSLRVTDETAPVAFEQPGDVLLHAPNQIGPADFEGWVQERGLYFAGKWDGRYAAPLSMHDPGEPPRGGSLLVGRLGKGRYIYTGLSFFRQLPAGVPGAVRLFANLLTPDRDAR